MIFMPPSHRYLPPRVQKLKPTRVLCWCKKAIRLIDAIMLQGSLHQLYRRFCHTEQMLTQQLAAQQQVLRHQSEELRMLRQTLNTVIRCQPIPTGRPVRVLFLIHNLNVWSSVAELIHRLSDHPAFEVIVLSINKRFPGQENYSGEEDVHDFLCMQAVPHLRFSMPDDQIRECLRALAPDVLFRQSQWDNDYSPALHSEQLTFTRLAIVPYGIANIMQNTAFNGAGKDSAVDTLFHRRCWRVYCANEAVIAQARENGIFAGRQFRCTGHPRVNWLRTITPMWPGKGTARRRVFWSPHHSVLNGWSDFGLFPSIWREMLALFTAMPETDFVFSPHPALLTLLDGPLSPLTPAAWHEFNSTLASLPNVFRHEGAAYAEVAAACDVLVTDGISLLLEGQLLNLPLIYIERQGHRPFNVIGQQLTSGWFTVEDVSTLAHTLQEWEIRPPMSLLENQRQNTTRLFDDTDAPGEIIRDLECEFRIGMNDVQETY